MTASADPFSLLLGSARGAAGRDIPLADRLWARNSKPELIDAPDEDLLTALNEMGALLVDDGPGWRDRHPAAAVAFDHLTKVWTDPLREELREDAARFLSDVGHTDGVGPLTRVAERELIEDHTASGEDFLSDGELPWGTDESALANARRLLRTSLGRWCVRNNDTALAALGLTHWGTPAPKVWFEATDIYFERSVGAMADFLRSKLG